ncbi:hypothetical protein AAFF_G00226970 [Aldrovandia affinis]|uniref:Uncharacterized protein n=1 Tax=Aldrovandia affinis TaxID=143900 RepID=A0AAD7X3D1_9TELE|nr:hypothetical protein AAFF_G00226970 [Aldrovandia affinis]
MVFGVREDERLFALTHHECGVGGGSYRQCAPIPGASALTTNAVMNLTGQPVCPSKWPQEEGWRGGGDQSRFTALLGHARPWAPVVTRQQRRGNSCKHRSFPEGAEKQGAASVLAPFRGRSGLCQCQCQCWGRRLQKTLGALSCCARPNCLSFSPSGLCCPQINRQPSIRAGGPVAVTTLTPFPGDWL